ncbi:hypothetical protein Tsubulata_048548 [Turnera subulata]|uniref:Galectin n=1 Tax=Turnera subulata TaxID=218843 RepID=A0A9Q0FSQ5_9ROSI|nr:hypothetical protein Tsubulata_048548 [Turnera subulata]
MGDPDVGLGSWVTRICLVGLGLLGLEWWAGRDGLGLKSPSSSTLALVAGFPGGGDDVTPPVRAAERGGFVRQRRPSRPFNWVNSAEPTHSEQQQQAAASRPVKALQIVVELPCGLTLGSHITVVGKPRAAHPEMEPKIALGLNTVEGEDPPRILHFNTRLKGDWSGRPVIELNTCYRMQWGVASRCEGWKSKVDDETVGGAVELVGFTNGGSDD